MAAKKSVVKKKIVQSKAAKAIPRVEGPSNRNQRRLLQLVEDEQNSLYGKRKK